MMRYRYDTDADAIYVTISDEIVTRTETLDDPTVLVDFDGSGQPVGLEVIHPRRPWPVLAILEAVGERAADRLLEALAVLGLSPENSYPQALGSPDSALCGAG